MLATGATKKQNVSRPGSQNASRNSFSDDFEFDFGGVLGARSAHILLLGCPGEQGMHVFWKSANELDF